MCLFVTFTRTDRLTEQYRYIIHFDLPKSFEGTYRLLRKMGGDMVPGYYQETGT